MVTREQVVEVLRTVEDPEIFIDVWTLGLIYDIEFEESKVKITMTFTSPACPAGQQLVDEIKGKVGALEGVGEAEVKVVFVPPWQPSEELKGMMGIY